MKEYEYFGFFQSYPWWILIPITFCTLLFFHISVNLLYKKYYYQFVKAHKIWYALLLKALHYPFTLFLWLIGVFILANLYGKYFFEVDLLFTIRNLIRASFILMISWSFYIFIREVETVFLNKLKLDNITISNIYKLSTLCALIFTIFLILPILKVETAGLISIGVFSGLIVSITVGDIFADLFSGLVLAFAKPFSIGDRLYSLDGSIAGDVENIGWRLTLIRDLSVRPVYIPNKKLLSMPYINANKSNNRCILETLSVIYRDAKKIPLLSEKLNTMIKNHPDLDQNSLLNYAELSKFGDFSLDITLRAFTITVKTGEFERVQQKVLIEVLNIIEECGVDLAFPTRAISEIALMNKR